MSNNNDSNSQEERLTHLTISEKQKAIMVRSVFAIDTGDIIISLNHKYESTKIIFTVDKNKWQKNRKAMKEIARENGVNDKEDINLLISHLDDNWQTIISKIKEANDEKSKRPKLSQVDVILDLFKEKASSRLFKDELKVPHAHVKIDDHFEVFKIASINFSRYLAKLYYENWNKVPNSEAIKNAVHQLEAIAYWNGETIPLHLRTAWSNETKDTIYYDLSDTKNRSVKINADGWTILENQTDVLFRRYNNQRPQIEPLLLSTEFDDVDDVDAVFDDFINLLNIKNAGDRLLLKCYIISLFIPDIPHVILILLGEQGGAKTMLQELIKQLVDPSITGTVTFPTNTNEFIQFLSHNYIVYYDNVSYIPDWVSDLLCRAVTGNSASKRALYTDDDDVYYTFKRKIGLNAIDLAKIKADLSDRSISMNPGRIDKFDRKKEEEIWTKFNELKPRLLSYIFNILSKVLAYKKNNAEITYPDGLNRMADWEEYAEIISRCMGNKDGELQRVYGENLSKQVDDAVASSQLCMAVMEFVDSHKEDKDNKWQENTPTDLHEKLTDIARFTLKLNNLNNKKYWPQSASSLSHNLNLVKTILREKGIEVITGIKNKDGSRLIKIMKLDSVNVPKTLSTPSTSSNDGKSSTNQKIKIDDVNNTGDKTPSNQDRQNQAQNSNSGRLDGLDDIFGTNNNTEEKNYNKEQEQKDYHKYSIKFSSDIKSQPYPISKELYDSLNGNKELTQEVLPEDIESLERENEAELKYEDDDYDENDYYSNNNEDED